MIGALASTALAVVLAAGPVPPDGGPLPPGRVPGPAPGLRAPDRCDDTRGPAGTDAIATVLRFDVLHAMATGAGVTVAVVDTGVVAHPRLAGRLTGGGDYVRGGSGLDDCEGHGTAVAGLLAAAPDPADGFSGIAPAANLVSIRQLSTRYQAPAPDGRIGSVGDTATLADAVVLAVRSGAKVVNVSEAACMPQVDATGVTGPLRAALAFAVRSDVVVVAAAGNTDSPGCGSGGVSLPGWLGDDVLTVGAVDDRGEPADFTVRGPWVDVAAPGSGLRSLAVPDGLTGNTLNGTSYAAPLVAGTAALLFQRYPGMTAREVMDRITGTARRPARPGDGAVGHGILDPVAALTVAPAASTSAAPGAPLAGLGGVPAPGPGATPVVAGIAAAATALMAIISVRVLRRPRPHR